MTPLPRHAYVHVPFCARRCSYCDFSIAVRKNIPDAEYVDALSTELDIRFGGRGSAAGAEGSISPWTVDTLYFGGGTPSRLGARGVAAMLEMLRARITLSPGAEVTLEANPEDVTREAAAAWANAGVNRLSLGSQSFDDKILNWMHRTHDSAAIGRAVDAARAAGIQNISLDLIFALPEGLERSWETDVARALELEPQHLSLYGLTVEPHTPLGRWTARGDVSESPEERYESEFLHAHDALGAAGFEHYEVSNFGRPGLHSRHNSSYWTGVPYAGLGPSAHEFDGTHRRWNVAAYAEWVRTVQAGTDPVGGREQLTPANRDAELVYLSLRTLEGLQLSGPEVARVQPWIEAGWARLNSDNRMVLEPRGWLRLDALAADLTLVRSHY